MAIADFNEYVGLVPSETARFIKDISIYHVPSVLMSLWARDVNPGAVPTTAVVPTNATPGAVGQRDSGAGTLRVRSASMATGPTSVGGVFVLADRLSHQGGLSGASSSEQTTNLPTAALTRYTTGEGVWPLIEVYANLGISETTVTASYTNQAGTAGRTSTATTLGSTYRYPAVTRLLTPMAGDTGVRSVESVTLAGSTGTTGNFGVTLIKPLLWIPVVPQLDTVYYDGLRGDFGGGMCEVQDGACLMWLYMPVYFGSLSDTAFSGAIDFCET